MLELIGELRSFQDATALGGTTADLARGLESLHVVVMLVHDRVDEEDSYAGWLTTSPPPT